MAIDSTCTGCGKTLRVPDEFAGKQARCPVCSSIYVVPMQTPASSSSSPWGSYDNSVELKPLEPTVPSPSPIASTSIPLVPDPRSSASSDPSLQSRPGIAARFYAKTPSGAEYGPVPADTILQWASEGRINDSCFVRRESDSQWIAFSSWKFQNQPRANPFSSSYSDGNSLGQVPNSGFQTITYAKQGLGGTVLALSIISWVLCITFIGSFICSLICVILGVQDLKAIQRGQVSPDGKTMTVIGLIIGGLNLGVCCLGILLFIIGAILN